METSFLRGKAVRKQEVLRTAVAVVITDMLRSAVDEVGGTGLRIRTTYGFRTQAAGKTGTTNDYTECVVHRFYAHLVAGVCVGLDAPACACAETGRLFAALPLWAEFMKEVYETVEPIAA